MSAKSHRMQNYGDTAAFVQVVQHGGFTAAAQATGVSKSRISQRVRELEQRLGTPLLKRSTRRLGLTEAGVLYLQECAPLIAGLERIEARVADLAAQPQGKVVITAPAWFATYVLAPLLVEFRLLNPGFRPEVVATHVLTDLMSEEVDLAFRLWIGQLPDSLLTARHLATLPQRIFAGMRYLTRRSEPKTPAELADHPALVTHVRKPVDRERWWLSDTTTAEEYAVDGVAIASDPVVLEAMMIAGGGLLLATELQMRGAIGRGEARVVLPAWRGRPVELYAILPAGRHSTHKVRLLLDFVSTRLSAIS